MITPHRTGREPRRPHRIRRIGLSFNCGGWYLWSMHETLRHDAPTGVDDSSTPVVLRYRRSPLIGDYMRGAAGAGMAGLPLILVDVHWAPGIVLASILAVFSAFLIRTAMRHAAAVTVDDDGIRVSGPLGRSLGWQELTDMTVKYFSTKRDRSEGWMTVRLDSSNANIKLESTLEGFDSVLNRAAAAARRNDLVLDDVTRANLTALGIDTGEDNDADGTGLITEGWDWRAVSGESAAAESEPRSRN